MRARSSGSPQPYLLPELFSLSLSHFLSPPDRAVRSSLTPAPRPSPAAVRRFLPQGPPQPRPAHPPHLPVTRSSSSPPESALHRRPPWEHRPSSAPSRRSAPSALLRSNRPHKGIRGELLHLSQPPAKLLPGQIDGNRHSSGRPSVDPLEARSCRRSTSSGSFPRPRLHKLIPR